MDTDESVKGHLAALLTIFIWGITFISTKVLLRSFQPIEILFFRFVLGFIALCVVYPHRLRVNSKKEHLLYAAAGLCGITLYMLLETIALDYTYASNASVIISIAPFFTALLASWLVIGDKPKAWFYFGFVVAMAGIVLVSFNGSSLVKFSPKGDLLMLGASVVWALYNIITRKISQYGHNTIQTTRRIFFYGLLFMIPALFLLHFHFDAARLVRPVNLLNILFLGLGASALCFATWNLALKVIGPVKTTVYMYAVPVVTMIASALILRDPITWMLVVGAALTLAGLVISEQGKRLFGKKV